MLIFGSIGLFARYIGLPSSVIALTRGVIGTLCLLAGMLLTRRKPDLAAVRRNLPLLAASGAAIGANWILFFQSCRYTTIATATLCYYLAPVFVVLLSPLLLKERLTPVKGLCVVAALAGMALVADVFGASEPGSNNTLGILCGLGAAALYAGIVLMNKVLMDIPALDSTAFQVGTAAAVLLPYVLLTENLSSFSPDTITAVLLITVGVIHTGIGYLLYFSSLAGLRGQTAAVLSYIDPITAIVLSSLILNESMSAAQIAGAALILGSTLFSELSGSKRAASIGDTAPSA